MGAMHGPDLILANSGCQLRRRLGTLSFLRPLVLLLSFGLPMLGSQVHGETLAQAIAFAYQTNPTLQSERALLRGTDETYVQARSQYGPVLDVEVSASYSNDRFHGTLIDGQSIPSVTAQDDTGRVRLSLSQPLYTAGRTALSLETAKWRIWSGREALRVTEGNIVYSVIQAYVDVQRDQQALTIRRKNLNAIAAQLTEMRARQTAGELTLTDVSQTEAQRLSEQANVALAENQLRSSEIAYASIVGRNPGKLEPAPSLPNLPNTIEEAWAIARDHAPEFQQALFSEHQSRSRLAEARATMRPTLSLRGTASYSAELLPFATRNFDRGLAGELVLSKPIFTGGRNRSVVRQSAEQNNADRLGIEAARRSMVQATSNAWNQALTFSSNARIQGMQREAAALAFKGMQVEYRAGERSTLDVLIAEQVLSDAELALLNTNHDAYLSEALLLRYIGRLDANAIVAGLPRYNPEDNFRRVRNKGAMPWEPAVRALDGIDTAGPNQRAIPAPEPANAPSIDPASRVRSERQPVRRVPVEPIPGTVSGVFTPGIK